MWVLLISTFVGAGTTTPSFLSLFFFFFFTCPLSLCYTASERAASRYHLEEPCTTAVRTRNLDVCYLAARSVDDDDNDDDGGEKYLFLSLLLCFIIRLHLIPLPHCWGHVVNYKK